MNFDKAMLQKYGVNGPRYTSYPTALQFHSQFGEDCYKKHADKSNQYLLPKPLSLYLHIPFCHSLCYYCGCHKFVTHDSGRVNHYLNSLHHEIRLQAKLFDKDREVRQIHFGGGTPTFLETEALQQLINTIKANFTIGSDVEMAIEIDPRTTDTQDVLDLKAMGFNRMSFGIQDFDEQVQVAINRVQDKKHSLDLLQAARAAGVESISVDIIYGLPKQSLPSFQKTLDTMSAIRPDRIALYHYAHIPERIKSQQLIMTSDLPGSDEKLDILEGSIQALSEAGYLHIGMDHFALPDDPLSLSLKEGKLHRNFQGYSTHGDCDIIGLGVSAISRINDSYSQNEKLLKRYQKRIHQHGLAIAKGYSLSSDDEIRADVIQRIMCQRSINFAEVSQKYHIYFEQYFYSELEQLKEMQKDGLLSIGLEGVTINDKGCVLLRNIAMVFDAYLRHQKEQNQPLYFSKAL